MNFLQKRRADILRLFKVSDLDSPSTFSSIKEALENADMDYIIAAWEAEEDVPVSWEGYDPF